MLSAEIVKFNRIRFRFKVLNNLCYRSIAILARAVRHRDMEPSNCSSSSYFEMGETTVEHTPSEMRETTVERILEKSMVERTPDEATVERTSDEMDEATVERTPDEATVERTPDVTTVERTPDETMVECTPDETTVEQFSDEIGETTVKSGFATTYGVVIIGNRGAGKRTIVNHWLLGGKELSLKENEESTTIFHYQHTPKDRQFTVYDVQLMDHKTSLNTPKNFISTCWSRMPRKLSLLIFVFKYGRFTNEEKSFFESVLHLLQVEKAQMITYLVITNCEGLSDESKKRFIIDFKENPVTAEIASYMKEIICVGLPDLRKVKLNHLEALKQDTIQSRKELNSLLKITPTSPSLTIDELIIGQPTIQEVSRGLLTTLHACLASSRFSRSHVAS